MKKIAKIIYYLTQSKPFLVRKINSLESKIEHLEKNIKNDLYARACSTIYDAEKLETLLKDKEHQQTKIINLQNDLTKKPVNISTLCKKESTEKKKEIVEDKPQKN